MANEVLVERKVYRIMADITNKLWHKIAWWTTANSVDAEDGRSLETKVGAINGITDSLTSTSSNIAASAKAVNTLNSNLAWKNAGTTTGTTNITVPLTAKEICVSCHNSESNTAYYNISIPLVNNLNTTSKFFSSGGSGAQAGGMSFLFTVGVRKTDSNILVCLVTAYIGNADKTANSDITVYYR